MDRFAIFICSSMRTDNFEAVNAAKDFVSLVVEPLARELYGDQDWVQPVRREAIVSMCHVSFNVDC